MSVDPTDRDQLIRSAILRSALAAVFIALLVVTSLWPDWLERTIGLEVDGGSGDAEWLVTGGVGLLAVVSASGAGLAWRRVVLQR
jgi:hypothetical protein